MKVEVIKNGTFQEIIDTDEEKQPFIFKGKYYKPLSDKNSIYRGSLTTHIALPKARVNTEKNKSTAPHGA